MKNMNWKQLAVFAAVGLITLLLAFIIKEKYDEYRLKKAMNNGSINNDIPMTESTSTGQLLSPVR